MLGIRLLRLAADIVVLPADSARRPAATARSTPAIALRTRVGQATLSAAPSGSPLAEAMRLVDETARTLERVRSNGDAG